MLVTECCHQRSAFVLWLCWQTHWFQISHTSGMSLNAWPLPRLRRQKALFPQLQNVSFHLWVECYPPQTLLLPGLTDQQAILVAPLYDEKIRSHFFGRNVFHGEKNNIPLDTVEDGFQQKIPLDRWRVNWNGSRQNTKSRGYDHASNGPSGPIPSK